MLICDKRRPRTRGDTNIRPPQGGRIKTAPPASGPRLGRPGVGRHAPGPLGCAPGAPSRTGPCCLVTQPEGFRHGCAVAGWATACGCPCPTPSPWRFSGFGEIQKVGSAKRCGGFGGRAPRCRATVGNPAQAVGGQGAAAGCARRPRTGRGCPRATGFRAER